MGRSSEFAEEHYSKTDMRLTADFSSMYVDVSGGFQRDQSETSKASSAQSSKESTMVYLGEKPDPITEQFSESLKPGILHKIEGTLCDLLTTDNPVQQLVKRDCERYVKSDLFCFNDLIWELNHDNEYENLRQSVFQMKMYERCGHVGIPMIGYKIADRFLHGKPRLTPRMKALEKHGGASPLFEKVAENVFGRQVKNMKDCHQACGESKSCALASFADGSCHVCNKAPAGFKDGIVDMFTIEDEDDRKHCALLRDTKLGIKPFPNDTHCRVQVESRMLEGNSGHCAESLVPCKPSENCYAHFLKTPTVSVVTSDFERRFGVSPAVGMPIHFFDDLAGEIIKSVPMKYRLDEPEKWAEYVSHFMDVAQNEELPSTDLVDTMSFKVAHACIEQHCKKTPGCDSVAVTIDHIPFDDIKSMHYFKRQQNSTIAEIDEKMKKFESRPENAKGKSFDELLTGGRQIGVGIATLSGDPTINQNYEARFTCDLYNKEEVILTSGIHDQCELEQSLCHLRTGQFVKANAMDRFDPGYRGYTALFTYLESVLEEFKN